MEEKSSPIPLIQRKSGRREVKQIGNASSQAWISVIPLDKYSQLHSSPLHRLLWKYFADTVKFISYCNEDSVKFLTVYRNYSSLQPGERFLFVPYSLRERSLVMQAQQLTLTNGGSHFNVDWRKGDAGLLGAIPRIPRDLPACNSFPTSAIVLDPYCPWEHKVVGAGQVPWRI